MKDDELFVKLWTDIAENFEWENVHNVMNHLDWKWVTTEATLEVPSLGRIMSESYKKCREAFVYKKTISSGGFTASYCPTDQILSLDFVLTDWEAYND